MASRSTTAACRSNLEAAPDAPLAEFGPLGTEKFRTVRSVRFVASPAAASFAVVDMHIVEILAAIAKFCIDGGFCKSDNILVVTS